MEIPECIHPLCKAWDQPENTEIEIDDTHALMFKKTFEHLKEYSCSIPTGVYSGKMWKAHGLDDEWYLRWYENDKENVGMCWIKSRVILVVKEE